MCSIGGWYAFGKARPNADIIRGLLLCGAMHGGTANKGSNDATGVAWLGSKDEIFISKNGVPAKEFVEAHDKKFWEEIARSPRGLLHNRAKTKGTVNQDSNHPLDFYGFVVVHNGTLNNDDDLFKHFKVERPADVDSVAIPLVLAQEKTLESSLKHLSVLSGGCTTAIWKVAEPEKIAIARLGNNELCLWWDDESKIVYWSSSYASSVYMRHWRMGALRFQSITRLADESAILLSPEKVRTFRIKRRPFTLPVVSHQSSYPPYKPDITGFPNSAHTPSGTEQLGTSGTTKNQSSTSFGARTVGNVGDWQDTPLAGVKAKLKWQQFSNLAVVAKKPVPMWEFARPWWTDRAALMEELLNQGPNGGFVEYKTPYGTWHLRALSAVNANGRITHREFSPIKRMKPYLHETFGKTPEIPVVRDDTLATTPLDHVLPLEHVTITEKNSSDSTTITKYGWMCPVCGIMDTVTNWSKFLSRCPMCEIAFLVPASPHPNPIEG